MKSVVEILFRGIEVSLIFLFKTICNSNIGWNDTAVLENLMEEVRYATGQRFSEWKINQKMHWESWRERSKTSTSKKLVKNNKLTEQIFFLSLSSPEILPKLLRHTDKYIVIVNIHNHVKVKHSVVYLCRTGSITSTTDRRQEGYRPN